MNKNIINFREVNEPNWYVHYGGYDEALARRGPYYAPQLA